MKFQDRTENNLTVKTSEFSETSEVFAVLPFFFNKTRSRDLSSLKDFPDAPQYQH